MNAAQATRAAKVGVEAFYFLGATPHGEGGFRVDVSGSTANVYTITMLPGRVLFCNCPDGKNNAKRLGVLCKHCVFLVQRVLRMDFAADVAASGLAVREDRWAAAAARTASLCRGVVAADVTDAAMVARFRAARGEAPPAPVEADAEAAWASAIAALEKLTEDDLCPICFLDLAEKPVTRGAVTALQSCRTCHGLVHADCMAKWLSTGRDACVRCNLTFDPVFLDPARARAAREPVRGAKGGAGGGYTNLLG